MQTITSEKQRIGGCSQTAYSWAFSPIPTEKGKIYFGTIVVEFELFVLENRRFICSKLSNSHRGGVCYSFLQKHPY